MTEIKTMIMWAQAFAATHKRDERGASDLVTTVILAGLFAVAAIAIAAIIITKLTDTATNIQTH